MFELINMTFRFRKHRKKSPWNLLGKMTLQMWAVSIPPFFFLSLQKTWLVRIMKLTEKSLCTSPPLSLSHTLTHERTQFNTWEVCWNLSQDQVCTLHLLTYRHCSPFRCYYHKNYNFSLRIQARRIPLTIYSMFAAGGKTLPRTWLW